MSTSPLPFKPAAVAGVLLVTALLFAAAWMRLELATDITGSLPPDRPVLADARYVVTRHPAQNQIVIDIEGDGDAEALVEAAAWIEERLSRSGLFEPAPMDAFQRAIPLLIDQVTAHLPVLFTETQLAQQVRPLLDGEHLPQRLDDNFSILLKMEGIGQGGRIAADPLGLRFFVLQRLANLSPSQGARLHRGRLLSGDARHALVIARPAGTGTDTTFGRRAAAALDGLSGELNAAFAPRGQAFGVTAFGAYRAALDNERLAKRDIRRLVLFATAGIALLLLLAFPRPYIGLFALLPALAGTAASFFLFSLWHRSISVMTLGFGGAIISITVDQGITYLLFVDRHHAVRGRDAAREVRAIGLLATLTSVGAFAALSLSGFSILAEIGQFAAVGIGMSFLFVHTVFPFVFPEVPAARRPAPAVFSRLLERSYAAGPRVKLTVALGFGLLMAVFAKPSFNADFRAMNTLSPETVAAQEKIASIWGDVFSRVFLLTEADTLQQLRGAADRLAAKLDDALAAGELSAAFSPSMLFPGQARAMANLAAWQRFWSPERKGRLAAALAEASARWGFTPEAFAAFQQAIERPVYRPMAIPAALQPLMGISPPAAGGAARWTLFSVLQSGPAYDAPAFFQRLAEPGVVRVFDPAYFSVRLGEYLAATFTKMAVIVGISVIALVGVFFFDLVLALTALLPLAFAFAATLGILHLTGRPLDIPGLMLSIIIMGMGIDYSLFLVRGYQRYRDDAHPSLVLIRLAVFLAAASTLIGFGTLTAAGHRLLQSAGLTCFLGIAFAFVGAFTLLPELLRRIFRPSAPGIDADVTERALRRFRHMEAIARLYAHWRLRRHPLYRQSLPLAEPPETIIAAGTGYGVSAAWLLESYPGARFYGLEPSPERARIAAIAVGDRGQVSTAPAPAVPRPPHPADLAVLTEGVAEMDEALLRETLAGLKNRLRPGGALAVGSNAAAVERLVVAAGYRLQAGPSGPWLIGTVPVGDSRPTTG